jgi:RNA recognition motif-containing protein
VFSTFGVVKSVFVKEEELKVDPKDGGEPQVVMRKFAFVCFHQAGNNEAGFISAERAV